MSEHILIEYPQELALALKLNKPEFEKEIKKISLLKLYELGKISSGFAANLLNVKRVEFLEILANYNVSIFPDLFETELDSDFRNA